jgi:hypothetical protein
MKEEGKLTLSLFFHSSFLYLSFVHIALLTKSDWGFIV